jgi:hypothetical protein
MSFKIYLVIFVLSIIVVEKMNFVTDFSRFQRDAPKFYIGN